MYTTMDCDFVETEYFYHHLRSQGESSGDDLSWLTYPEIGIDPKEQVDTTAETTDNIIQFDQIGTITNDHTTLSEDPPSNKVCNPDSSHNTESTNLSFEDESIKQNILSKTPESSESGNEDVESEQVSCPENYVLPPRSTRGIPPKRYNPDFEAQRSKYPVGKPETPGRGVLYESHGHLDLHAFTNADWGGDRDSRKSTSGYFTLVGGNLVSWKSKRQKKVSMSSAEAEFRGIAKRITEVLWHRKLFSELGMSPKKSCKLYCDNKAAIRISENPVQHDRTKHVEIDIHFIKDHLEAKGKASSMVAVALGPRALNRVGRQDNDLISYQ
uniref:Uncharacterized protein n=1 Tax=Chenopodium quinoa TaxID=63459 RepID=A0A803NBZ0_CHEQI